MCTRCWDIRLARVLMIIAIMRHAHNLLVACVGVHSKVEVFVG
jgi:hypothetical protein